MDLDNRLGLRITPAEVRLQPSYEDGYAWAVTNHKGHLLERSLSNGTVGLYDAICEELNKSIEAVHPETLIKDSVCSYESNVSHLLPSEKEDGEGQAVVNEARWV